MPEYCKECKNEILPYLRTGELKQINNNERLKTFQLFYCVHCKIVYYKTHEEFNFVPLERGG